MEEGGRKLDPIGVENGRKEMSRGINGGDSVKGC